MGQAVRAVIPVHLRQGHMVLLLHITGVHGIWVFKSNGQALWFILAPRLEQLLLLDIVKAVCFIMAVKTVIITEYQELQPLPITQTVDMVELEKVTISRLAQALLAAKTLVKAAQVVLSGNLVQLGPMVIMVKVQQEMPLANLLRE